MNEPTTTTKFSNPELGFELNALVQDDPEFIANEVCKILGLNNVSMALSRLNEDDISSTDVISEYGTEGAVRRQRVKTVNESGLYDLVLSSRKPEAKKFRRWVTKDVLPEIRRDGSYVAPNITTQQTIRLIEKTDYKAVTDALAFANDYSTRGIGPGSFANFQNGFYKAVLGKTAREFKEERGIEKGSVKDHLNPVELSKLQGLSMSLLGDLRMEYPEGVYTIDEFAAVYHSTIQRTIQRRKELS